MNKLGSFLQALSAPLWTACVLFTLIIALILLLRPWSRRWFGAPLSMYPWALLPLSLLIGLLPHNAPAWRQAAPMVAWISTLPQSVDHRAMAASTHLPWRQWLVALWLVGVLLMTLRTVWAQAHYRHALRDALLMAQPFDGCRVVSAVRGDQGPALVGLWRPCIVLPADFGSRYSAQEQQLILAHEHMHLRRRDNLLALFAYALCLPFWFHPLAWIALRAFRQDQELACDAAVMREHPGLRRSYADAMLKTQTTAFAPPLGCSWTPIHPIRERIAMLKLAKPSARRRQVGISVLSVFGLLSVGAAYAVSASTGASNSEYQLELEITPQGREPFPNTWLCGRSGVGMEERGSRSDGGPEVALIFTPSSHLGGVNISVKGSVDQTPVQGRVVAEVGKPMTVKLADASGASPPIKVNLTATLGCAARDANEGAKPISLHLENVDARDAANQIAIKAGLVVANPDGLDQKKVSFNFESIPVARALQLIADADGRNATVVVGTVTFEPK